MLIHFLFNVQKSTDFKFLCEHDVECDKNIR